MKTIESHSSSFKPCVCVWCMKCKFMISLPACLHICELLLLNVKLWNCIYLYGLDLWIAWTALQSIIINLEWIPVISHIVWFWIAAIINCRSVIQIHLVIQIMVTFNSLFSHCNTGVCLILPIVCSVANSVINTSGRHYHLEYLQCL